MPRKKSLVSPIAPYHVSARSHNRSWFAVPMPDLWELFSDYLSLVQKMYGLEILNFVLMTNHYHMVVVTPEANLSQAMNYLQREVSRAINRHSGRINQTFGGPYNWSLITKPEHLWNVYKYVYRNPVDAGLVARVEDYRYSTLNGLIGRSRLVIPIKFDAILFSDLEAQLSWLNEPFPGQDMRTHIRAALRHRQFLYGKDRDRKPPYPDTISTTFPEKVRRTSEI